MARSDNITFILNKVRSIPSVKGDPPWTHQVLADLERHEAYREYAYPDPLTEWGKKYKSAPWGTKPASVIMAELGLDVKDVAKGAPWTVGIGFTHGTTYKTRTTRAESYERLKREVFEHAEGLDKLLPGWRESQPYVVQTVLVNMIFNLGTTRLSKFAPTLALFAKGDYKGAASRLENTAWYKQVGHRSKELVERLRTGEIQKRYMI